MWRRRSAWWVVPLALFALLAATPVTYSVFSDSTATSATLATAAAFPAYPASVNTTAPQLYHRGEEAPSYASSNAAADSSASARPGAYAGATDGPSLHWKLDDGSGTTAYDSSGAANPGALTAAPTWSGGHIGTGGLTVDGSTQYASSARSAVDTSGSFSVAAWVRLGATPAGDGSVLSQDGTSISGFTLEYRPGADKWAFGMYDSDSTGAALAEADTDARSPVGRWTHLAGVYDDAKDTLSLFVDGNLTDTSVNSTDWSAAGPLVAGAARWNGSRAQYLDARIDDVRAYRRALSGTEVSQVYGAPATWWPFDGSSSADASGNADDGTTTGGPTYSGNGIQLNGTSQYVTGATAGMHTDRGFSVAAWVRPDAVAGTDTIVSRWGTNANQFALTQTGATYRFTMSDTDTAVPATTTVTAVTPAAAGTLAHVVAVYDQEAAGEIHIYVNGVHEARALHTGGAWDATSPLTAGRDIAGNYFGGLIDDVRVFHRVLTPDDVHNLYVAPLARYDFDDNLTDTAIDTTGNGNTMTRQAGTLTWAQSSHRAGALQLPGSGAYLTAAGPVLDTSTSYSVTAWARVDVTTGLDKTIIAQDGADTSAFMLQHYTSGATNTFAFQFRPADATAGAVIAQTANGVPSAGRWFHLAGVYDDDADQIRLYVNGVLAASAPTGTADFNATGPLIIGGSIDGGSRSNWWQGRVDEVTAYQRVLSAAEILAGYDVSPHVWQGMGEGSGTIAGDRSGGTMSSTLTNGASWETGRYDTAVGFDGVDDHTIGTSNVPIATDQSFSVAAWVYLSAKTKNRVAVSKNGTNYYGFGLGYASVADSWAFSLSNTDVNSPTLTTAQGGTAALNTWVHLAGVYDDAADRVWLYINGKLSAVAAKTVEWTGSAPMVMGYGKVAGATNTTQWNGRVDDVRMYQRAIAPAEIRALMGNYFTSPSATAVHLPAATAQLPGALQGPQQGLTGARAMAYNGTATPYNGNNGATFTGPAAYSIECWFRVSGPRGGTLAGFTTSATSMATDALRALYVDSGGRLTFGVSNGGTETAVRSGNAYDDGAWHHVAATQGPTGGLRLYVDGALVQSAGNPGAPATAGYWRWASVSLAGGWPHRPAADHLTGTIDELAVYHTELTATDVARHYYANH